MKVSMQLPVKTRFGVYVAYKYYLSLFKKIKKKTPDTILEQRVRIPNYGKAFIVAKQHVTSLTCFKVIQDNSRYTMDVILVDERDVQVGTMEKLEVHQKALLHRAFSIFIFNSRAKCFCSKGLQTNITVPGCGRTLVESPATGRRYTRSSAIAAGNGNGNCNDDPKGI